MTVIGIDPGKAGSVSFFSADWMHVEKLPQDARELLWLLREYSATEEITAAYLEQIYLPTGKAGALTFASGWGKIIAVLEILGLEHVKVRPQVWMKALDCLTKGDKNITKAKAKELFGHVVYDDGKKVPITHWSSDGLLIGYYGYLQEGGEL
jgi:hypothetical protein